MSRRPNLKPDSTGRIEGTLDLAEYSSSGSFDEMVIDASPYDYVTVQLVAETTITIGTGSIKVRRSNDGVHAVEFAAGAVSLTAVGMSAEQVMRTAGFLHLQVGSSADPTTASGRFRAFVKFHKAP